MHIRDQTSDMTNSSFLSEVFGYCTQNYVVKQHIKKTLLEIEQNFDKNYNRLINRRWTTKPLSSGSQFVGPIMSTIKGAIATSLNKKTTTTKQVYTGN